MRDPPRKVENGRGRLEIQGIVRKGGRMKIVADMVQGHNDHDQATEQINGFNPVCFCEGSSRRS